MMKMYYIHTTTSYKMNYGVLGGSSWPVYSSEGNSERTFETAQDGNTTRLCLPKYSQPHQTNWRYAKYRNLLLMKGSYIK